MSLICVLSDEACYANVLAPCCEIVSVWNVWCRPEKKPAKCHTQHLTVISMVHLHRVSIVVITRLM